MMVAKKTTSKKTRFAFLNRTEIYVFLLLSFVAIAAYIALQNQHLKAIDSFEKCKDAGFRVAESYPEQCITSDGRSFINTVVQAQSMTVSGETVCLPHRDQTGEQTLECALGLLTPDGIYYSLRDSDPAYKNVSSAGTGEQVEVVGLFTPQNDTKYQSIGILTVESLQRSSN